MFKSLHWKVCQQTELITSETLVDFFRSAQQDTLNAHQESITLKICLENGQFETIRVLSSDSLCRVKQKLCDQLRLPNNLNNLFDLFMIQSSVNIQNPQQASCGFFDELIVRKISDLESPYLTLCIANRGQTQFGLYWRRFYWNPEADEQLANNELTSKLVCAAIRRFFLQNESEISSDYLKHMDTLRLRPNKREVLSNLFFPFQCSLWLSVLTTFLK